MTSCFLHKYQINVWHAKFKEVSYPTKFLHLPHSFLTYLKEDGFFLNENSKAFPKRVVRDISPHLEESDDEDCNIDVDNSDLIDEVDLAILELSGAVSPKLNWSCPTDAVWMSCDKSHRCTNAEEVLALLKASCRVSYDLERLPIFGNVAILALRKWFKLEPSREFRCFVRNSTLIGISQRQLIDQYPNLYNLRGVYASNIYQFFKRHLESYDLNFCFDVYITSNLKVKLLDISPITNFTNPLLFTWEELGFIKLAQSTSSSKSQEDSKIYNEFNEYTLDIDINWQKLTSLTDNEWLCTVENDTDSKNEMTLGVMCKVITDPNTVNPNLPTYGIPYDLICEGVYDNVVESLEKRNII